MAEMLEKWGEGNVWDEIQYFMINCNGRVLDIACGTGKCMEILSKFTNIDVYGIDISDLLINQAIRRGIDPKRLVIGDATKLGYTNNYFNYGYSIGSLEHFTEEGIDEFISECHRVVEKTSFHMIPVSKSNCNEGWLKTYQSFFNNNVQWWLEKFQTSYQMVQVLDSRWEDNISLGKWFICSKGDSNND